MLMRRAAAFAKSGFIPRSVDPCAALEKKVQFVVTFARTVRVRSVTIEGKRGHFHGHEHTCTLTRRQSKQTPSLATLPESLRGLPRAHDHIISHAAAPKGAQNREVRKAPREHRGKCGGSARQPRGNSPVRFSVGVAPSLRLPRQPHTSLAQQDPCSSDLDEARERNDHRSRLLWGID